LFARRKKNVTRKLLKLQPKNLKLNEEGLRRRLKCLDLALLLRLARLGLGRGEEFLKS
jgi:hypothetical protein